MSYDKTKLLDVMQICKNKLNIYMSQDNGRVHKLTKSRVRLKWRITRRFFHLRGRKINSKNKV